MVAVFERIADVTLNADTTTITFSDIPQSYEHLRIEGIIRLTRAVTETSLGWRANNDSGASSYSYYGMQQAGGTFYLARIATSSFASAGVVTGSTATANIFSGIIMDIADYSSTTKVKSYQVQSGYDRSGYGYQAFFAGAYKGSTNAITRLDFSHAIVGGPGDVAQYSSLVLYGVRSSV